MGVAMLCLDFYPDFLYTLTCKIKVHKSKHYYLL